MLEITGLDVRYGGVGALHGVSLSAGDDETVGIIGANGAGKSSLLRSIVGLVRPVGGEIRFMGERIDRMSPRAIVRRGIALSPEGRRVFRHMSVRENLLTGAYLQTGRRRIRSTMERVVSHFPRLAERMSQPAGSLSGGEQQMLAIGRALMSCPKLLLLDEPSLGLAPLMMREIGRIVDALRCDEGIAVVLVEQNAQLALRMSHRAYVFESGRVALSGTGRDLLRSEVVQQAYLGL